LSLGIQDNRGEAVVALNLQQMRLTVVEDHLLYPGGTLSSSTLTGHTFQHALLMLSLLAAWPVRRYSER
ncbi:hypothetical protein, partial [Sulfuricella sp. T08]|uniref:hypothetical protein n=1 Tax=Sulfuricella sp. T08 TaxID=1632857 RepID=UPI00131F0518